ncbi:MAG: hypothetical protein ABL999_07275 [Pyrinomonadaceae bacterium]
MSSFVWIFVLVLTLTVLGSSALLFVTVKYYWGDRGKPPLTGEERRAQYEKELEMRAKQLEYSRTHPPKPRSLSFFDNTKQS